MTPWEAFFRGVGCICFVLGLVHLGQGEFAPAVVAMGVALLCAAVVMAEVRDQQPRRLGR